MADATPEAGTRAWLAPPGHSASAFGSDPRSSSDSRAPGFDPGHWPTNTPFARSRSPPGAGSAPPGHRFGPAPGGPFDIPHQLAAFRGHEITGDRTTLIRLDRIEKALVKLHDYTHEADESWVSWDEHFSRQLQDIRSQIVVQLVRTQGRVPLSMEFDADILRFQSERDKMCAGIRYEATNAGQQKLHSHTYKFMACSKWTMLSNLANWMDMAEIRLLELVVGTNWAHANGVIRYRVAAFFFPNRPAVIAIGATDEDMRIGHLGGIPAPRVHMVAKYKVGQMASPSAGTARPEDNVVVGLTIEAMLQTFEKSCSGQLQYLERDSGHSVSILTKEQGVTPGQVIEQKVTWKSREAEASFFNRLDTVLLVDPVETVSVGRYEVGP